MAYIGREPTNSGQFLIIDDISSNFNSSNTSFNLTIGGNAINPAKENIIIALDGVLQQSNESYAVTGSTISFTEAPGPSVSFYGLLTGESQFIANESISNDKISPTANISGSKINTDFSAQNIQITQMTASGNISGSSTTTGSFGRLQTNQANALFGSRTVTFGGNLTTGGTVTTVGNLTTAGALTTAGTFTIQNNNLTINAADAARTLTLTEDFTIGGGNSGTLTYSGASKTLTVADTITLSGGGNTLTLAGDLTTQNNNVTINAVGAARTITLNESLTVGDGNDGTITFSGASKTLTVEDTSVVNQDLTSDASPTFAGGTVTGNFTVGGTLTAQEIHTEFTSASIVFTSGSTTFGDTADDVHERTGSLNISGSLTLNDGTLTVTDDLSVDGTTNLDNTDIDGTLTVDGGNIVFNEDSADQDFRVESNGNTHMLFVDGGNNRVGVGTSTPAKLFHVEGSTGGDFLARIKNIDSSNGEGLGILTNNTNSLFRILHAENSNGRVFTIFNDAKVMIGDGSQQNFSASSASLHIAQNEPSIRLQDMNHAPGSFCLINANSGAGGLEIIADGNNTNAGSNIDFQVDGGSKMVISGSGQIGMGTSNPSQFLDLTFAGEDGMAINSTNSNATLFLQANGTNKWIIANAPSQHELFISSAATAPAITIKQDGKVGIGTNSPGRQLDIVAPSDAVALNLRMRSNDDFSFITFTDHDVSEAFIGQIAVKRTGAGTGEIQFYTSGDNERMQINASGDVGIGVSPSVKLHVKEDNSSDDAQIKVENDGTGDAGIAFLLTGTRGYSMGIDNNDGDKFIIGGDDNAIGTTPYLTIDHSNSNVGIGTTAPLTALHVHGAAGDPASSGTTPTAITRFGTSGINSVLDIGQGASPYPMFIQAADRSNLAQFYKLSLNPVGGNVGVGTLNPGEAFEAAGGNGTAIQVNNTSGDRDATFRMKCATNSQEYRMGLNVDNVEQHSFSIKRQDTGGIRFRIKADGDFVGSTSADISDERMKENIQDLSSTLEKINKLKPISYTWKKEAEKNTDKVYLGLLAQNVESYFPDLVTDESIMDTEDIKYKSLSYTGLIAPMVKAIQELSAKIEELEKKSEN